MADKKRRVTIGADGTIHVEPERNAENSGSAQATRTNAAPGGTSIGADGTIHVNRGGKASDAPSATTSQPAGKRAQTPAASPATPQVATTERPTALSHVMGVVGVVTYLFGSADTCLREALDLTPQQIIMLNDIGEPMMLATVVFFAYAIYAFATGKPRSFTLEFSGRVWLLMAVFGVGCLIAGASSAFASFCFVAGIVALVSTIASRRRS